MHKGHSPCVVGSQGPARAAMEGTMARVILSLMAAMLDGLIFCNVLPYHAGLKTANVTLISRRGDGRRGGSSPDLHRLAAV